MITMTTRKQRRMREHKIRSRLRKGRPMFMQDNRWKFLSPADTGDIIRKFKEMITLALVSKTLSFDFIYAKHPEFDEIIKSLPGAVLMQVDDTMWTCDLHMVSVQSAIAWQLAYARSLNIGYWQIDLPSAVTDNDLCIARDANVAYYHRQDDQHVLIAIAIDSPDNPVATAMQAGELRIDMLRTIDGIRRRRPMLLVPDTSIVGEVRSMPVGANIDTVNTTKLADNMFRVDVTYKNAVDDEQYEQQSSLF